MSVKSLLRFKRRFLLLFAVAVLFSAVSGVYFVRYLVKPNTGLVVNYPEVVDRDGRVIFAPKTPFSPAVSSGLQPNTDQIVSINGSPIHSIRDVVEADSRIWGFHPFPVDIIRDGSQHLRINITPAFTLTQPDWVFALVFCITLAFMSFYLILYLPEDKASNLVIFAALFYLIFTAVKPFYYESFFSNLMIHFGKLTSWFMVFFALYFPSPRATRTLRRILMGAVLGIYLTFTVFRMFYFSSWVSSSQDLWLVRYRFLGKINNISDGVAFVVYLALLIRSYVSTPHANEKRQLEWIIAGFLIAIPPYFFLDQLPLILGGAEGLRISMGNFANLFLCFVPLFFIIGLLKHRVFNIRFFVSRYVVYIILALLIFAFFTVLYEPTKNLFILSYGVPDRIASFLVTAILFVFLIPIRSLFCSLIDRLFYRKHYRRSVQYSASLERRNMELKLLIDELNLRNMRSFQKDRMRELRGIVTGITHRVNNPVNFISSSLTALDRKLRELFRALENAEQPSAEEVRRLHRELQKLISVAQEGDLEIRDFLRRLATLVGSRTGVPVSVSMGHLLSSAAAELGSTDSTARIRIEEDRRAAVFCNPDELMQVLRYIVENALESGIGPKDEVLIRADLFNRYYRIQIRDEGMGIDSTNLRKIYDPFFSTKSDHDGLGLYFSRMLVERNAGSMEVTSNLGIGTTVTILLPREDPDRDRFGNRRDRGKAQDSPAPQQPPESRLSEHSSKKGRAFRRRSPRDYPGAGRTAEDRTTEGRTAPGEIPGGLDSSP
jgi:two-component system NtrC family sensor kinase